jgi:uncharacterized protein YdeI (BOF family)
MGSRTMPSTPLSAQTVSSSPLAPHIFLYLTFLSKFLPPQLFSSGLASGSPKESATGEADSSNAMFSGPARVRKIGGISGILLGILMTQGGCRQIESTGTKLGVPIAVNVNTISIADLEKTAPEDTTVYLKGTIGKHAPILQGAVYELRDSTGSVWVRAQGTVPNPGDQVTIKGITRYKPIEQNGQQQRSLFVDQQDVLQTQPPAKS